MNAYNSYFGTGGKITFQEGGIDVLKAFAADALSHIFPVKWNSFVVADDEDITWAASDERAEVRLADGAKAQVILNSY